MRWLHSERQPDVWEVADDQPLGDIGAAHKIRDICASAGTIAERLVTAGGRDAERKRAADDAERYQAAIKRALEIAMQISDDPMRDVSVTQIIKLCVQVDHLKTARVLLRAIQSEKMRAELVAEHPKLIDQDAAN
jgi:methylmalonyl-CoA mutase N-terminal domain/subunit